MLRGLAFLAVTNTYYYKDNDCNDVGSHFEKFLHAYAEVGNIVVNNKESAEENGTENADVWLPYGKDNKGDGKPASVAEAVVSPCAGGVIHNEIKSAETRNHTADYC